MRIMGLDYGSKTVGIAISDEGMTMAQPLETVVRERENKLRRTLARIEQLIVEYQVSSLLLGYPKNMDDTMGERSEKTRAFKEMLERRTGLETTLWDERLTTVSAERILKEAGIRGKEQKPFVDKMAAAIILQGYLDYKNHKENLNGGK